LAGYALAPLSTTFTLSHHEEKPPAASKPPLVTRPQTSPSSSSPCHTRMPSNRRHSLIRKEAGSVTKSPRIHRPPSLPFDAQPEGTRETSSRLQDPSFTALSRFWHALLVNWAHLSRTVHYSTRTPLAPAVSRSTTTPYTAAILPSGREKRTILAPSRLFLG
ncbi:hypothetical protein CABS01_11435, partial [Colletotrichum abscissum]|uniref:uncharacterized protein n=1 Tax=Colletotrichum abscissum TaxID=1671311 RepID=UPI0027D5B65E